MVERKYLSDSKGTKNWWMAVYLCLLLSIFVHYCPLLSKICNEFSCTIRVFFVTLYYNK